MRTTINPAAWAEQLRAINQAFALQEQALLTRLADASSELEGLRSRVAELAAEEARSKNLLSQQESSFQTQLISTRAERFDFELLQLREEFRAQQEERERTFEAEKLSLLREAQAAAAVRAELVELQESARTQLAERAVREQKITEQWLAMHAQFEHRLAVEAERHNDQLARVEAIHLERERSWQLLSGSAASDCRARIESEQLQRVQLQHALAQAEHELANILDSALFRLTGWFGRQHILGRTQRTLAADLGVPSPAHTTPMTAAERTMRPPDHPGKDAQPTDVSTMTMQTRSAADASSLMDLQTLLRCGGDDFVHAAYLRLLGRKVDADGLHFYRLRLLDGISKLQILDEIAQSPEAVTRGVVIPGLRGALRRQRWLAVPILGPAIGWLRHAGHRSVASMQLQALEARTEYNLRELRDRLSSLDEVLTTLHDEFRRSGTARTERVGSIAADHQGAHLSLGVPNVRYSGARSRHDEPSPLEASAIRNRSQGPS